MGEKFRLSYWLIEHITSYKTNEMGPLEIPSGNLSSLPVIIFFI